MMDLVSKGEFAKLIGVSPSRVSQYVSAGKIYGEALVGAGRSSRIRPAVACVQLKTTLDFRQRFGVNGKAQLGQVNSGAAETTVRDPLDEDIKHERLEGLRRDNRRKAEEEAARSGRYMLAEDGRQQMGRIASQMLNTFDGWLGEVAAAASAKFSLPQRDILHLLRSEFRAFRARSSDSLRQQSEEIAELIEDKLPESDAADDVVR